MPTNLAIDDDLLEEAVKVGGLKTKRETVNEALKEFIALRRRRKSVQAFGTIEVHPKWDYKRDRKHR